MSRRFAITVGANPAYASLTDLRAQLCDNVGTDTGSPITTGFSVDKGGAYWWNSGSNIANGFDGGVRFYSNAASTVTLGFYSFDEGNVTSSGVGAYVVSITVNDGSTALPSASVRMTLGTSSWTSTTNVSGVALFGLDAGAYTLSITKGGYEYVPTTETISGTASITRSMSATSISPSTDPLQTTGYLTTYDEGGDIEAGVVLTFRLLIGPGALGMSYDDAEFMATSNGSGVLTVTLLRSATYEISRGGRIWVQFPSGSASTVQLPEILGTP